MNALSYARAFVHMVVYGGFFILLIAALWSDLKERLIPNRYTLCLGILWPLWVLTAPLAIAWWWHIGGAAAVFLVSLFLFSRGFWGGGDAKLISVLALWSPPAFLLNFLMITALCGGVLSLYYLPRALRWRKKARLDENPQPFELPYGVAISFGGFYLAFTLLA